MTDSLNNKELVLVGHAHQFLTAKSRWRKTH